MGIKQRSQVGGIALWSVRRESWVTSYAPVGKEAAAVSITKEAYESDPDVIWLVN